MAESSPGVSSRALPTQPLAIDGPREGSIRGTVYSTRNKSLQGMQVVLSGPSAWPPQHSTTGPSGAFAFTGLTAGLYELRARRGNLVVSPRRGLSLAPQDTLNLRLIASPGRALRGRVRDAYNQRAIKNASITLLAESLNSHSPSVLSDAQGEFQIGGLYRGEDYWLIVNAPRYNARSLHIDALQASDLNIDLWQGSRIEGRVETPQGRALSQAKVLIKGTTIDGKHWQREEQGLGFMAMGELGVTRGPLPPIPGTTTYGVNQPKIHQHHALSDAGGIFVLPDLPPGDYTLQADHPEHAPSAVRTIHVGLGETPRSLKLRLRPSGVLEGKVVDLHQRSVSNARVTVNTPLYPDPITIYSDERGRFIHHGLVGRIEIHAKAGEQLARPVGLNIRAGRTHRVELQLYKHTHHLSARVVDSKGRGIANAWVEIFLDESKSSIGRIYAGNADNEGRFRASELPPPPYVVSLRAPEFLTTNHKIASLSQKHGVQALMMQRGIYVRGTIVDRRSKLPIHNAKIIYISSSTDSANEQKSAPATRSSTEGAFTLHLPEARAYVLRITHPEYLSAQHRLNSSQINSSQRIDLSAGAWVEGVVRDRFGTPVPAAQLSWSDTPSPPRDSTMHVRSDAQGRFRLSGVAPSQRIYVHAFHAYMDAYVSSRPLRLRPKETYTNVELRFRERLIAP